MQPSDPQPDGADGRGRSAWGPVLAMVLWVVAVVTWRSALEADFVFDDVVRIVGEERLIVAPWDSWDALVCGQRPLVQLTLGLNHSLGGLDPRGYHAFNVLVHATAAVAAFAAVLCCIRRLQARRAIELPESAAFSCAFSIALLWSLHPLQTAAATYVIQRAESMAGLFTLAAVVGLCCAARAVRAQPRRARAAAWGVATFVCCVLAIAAKPTAAAAPAILLAIDAFVVAGSLRAALRERWPLHVALWSTTLALVPLGVVRGVLAGGAGNAGAGLRVAGTTPLHYASMQVRAVGLYMGEVACPWLMSIDHGPEELSAPWTAAVGGTTVVAVVLLSAFAFVRGRWWGVIPVFFALALAPASSFVPLADVAADHRMYLPLLAVVAAAVAACAAAWNRARRHGDAAARRARLAMTAILLVLVACESFATSVRNRAYADPLVLWDEVIERRPSHVRARVNRAAILMQRGRDEEAQRDLDVAGELRPQDPLLRLDWAVLELRRGHADAALELLTLVEPALRNSATLHGAIGESLRLLGRPCAAAASFRRAADLAPGQPRWRVLEESSRSDCGADGAAQDPPAEGPGR